MEENIVLLTDWIQAIVAVIGLIISVIAIIISWRSISLTKKSILESNRPVISVYLDYTYVLSSLKEYIVIKNFGKTQGKIVMINLSKEISFLKDKSLLFSKSLPFTLSPNQSFSTVLENNAYSREDGDEDEIIVDLVYSDFSGKTYKESFLLNQNIVRDMKLSKSIPSKNTSLQKVIALTAEEIIRKNL